MIKKTYEFTITEAPITNTIKCDVPEEIYDAAIKQGITLLAFADKTNGSIQLGSIIDGEQVLILVTVKNEKESVPDGDNLRQEVQKLMLI